MSAATSTIITGIALGASAAGGIYSAKKQADTAKQASQVQVNASNKAMDYQQQATQQARAYAEGLRTAPLQPLQGPTAGYLQQRLGIPSQGSYGGLMGSSGSQPPPVQFNPSMGSAPTSGQPPAGYRALLGQPTSTRAPLPTGQPGMMGASQPQIGAGAPQAMQAAAGDPSAAQPMVGTMKTFPNGAVGRWDGRGWEQV